MSDTKKVLVPVVIGAVFAASIGFASGIEGRDPARREAKAKALLQNIPQFASVPLNRSRNGPGVSFTLSLKKSCWIGDWDLIEAEMQASDQPRFLLTIESLPPSAAPPLSVMELPMSALQSGSQINLPIPEPAGLSSLGVFICKDSDGKGRCSGKPLASISELTKLYRTSILVNQPPAQEEGVLDKIYFSSFLMTDSESIYFPRGAFDQASYQKLAEALVLLPSGAADAGLVVEQIHAADTTLRSVPLHPVDRNLRLELPDFDSSACKSTAPRPRDGK